MTCGKIVLTKDQKRTVLFPTRLRGAAEKLATREEEYRAFVEAFGCASGEARHARDLLRKAGETVRYLLDIDDAR